MTHDRAQTAGYQIPPHLTPEQRAERDRLARETERKQRQFIHDARSLLNPTPVLYGKIPNWLRLRLLGLLRGRRQLRASCASWAVLGEASRIFDWTWLDHYGTTTFRGRPAFVSEPYHLSRRDIDSIDGLCKAIGCEWGVSANSYHFPGSTIRVVIYKPGEQEIPTRRAMA